MLETHGHWDHIQAVPAVRDAGYEVGVTAGDAGMLDSYDYLLEDDSVIEVGRLRLHTILTPGHTPGSMCFRLEGSPVLFSGDTLFPGGPGNTKSGRCRLRHDHRVDRPPAVRPARPPTRSCCPATATTPRSAPSARTCRSGSTGAGEPSLRLQLARVVDQGLHVGGQRRRATRSASVTCSSTERRLARTATHMSCSDGGAVVVVEVLGPLAPHGGQRALDGADDVGDGDLGSGGLASQ